jgi:hypothetical protein
MGKRSILAMAMEEIENEEVVAEVPAETPALDTETEEVVAEVVDETEEAATDAEDIEEASADVGDLETIADAVDEAAEGDGLSPEAAKVVEVAVESIYRRLGLKSNGTLAAETFSKASSRKMATEAMGENIKAGVKKAWAAIVRFFENAVASVKAFFAKLFDANLRLKSAGEAMVKRAGDTKGEVEKEIKAGSFVSSLTMGGKFSPADVSAGLSEMTKFADEVISSVTEFGNSAALTEADVASMIKGDAAKDKEFGLSFLKGLKEVGREDGAIILSSDELPGNRALKATVPADWKQAAKIALVPFSKSRIRITEFDAKAKGFEGDKVQAADAKEAGTIAASVVAMCTTLEKRKAATDSLQKDLATMVASVKKAAGKGEEGKGVREVQAFMSRAGNVISGLPTAVTGACVKSGKAALEYCAKSLATAKAAA